MTSSHQRRPIGLGVYSWFVFNNHQGVTGILPPGGGWVLFAGFSMPGEAVEVQKRIRLQLQLAASGSIPLYKK